MRTHPTPVVTTIPTGQTSMAAVSAHWLILAAVGLVLMLVVAAGLAVINSAAHSTVPTLDRALWVRDFVLAPSAAACCALLVTAVLGTSHELAAERDTAHSDAIDKTQSALADQSSTDWDCQAVDAPDPSSTTVSCTPIP